MESSVQGADALVPLRCPGVAEVGNEGLSILDVLLQRLGLICARAAAVSDRCVCLCECDAPPSKDEAAVASLLA